MIDFYEIKFSVLKGAYIYNSFCTDDLEKIRDAIKDVLSESGRNYKDSELVESYIEQMLEEGFCVTNRFVITKGSYYGIREI